MLVFVHIYDRSRGCLFGGLVLGDGLGAFRDGVLGQFTGKDQTNGGLNFAGRDGGALVVSSELGGFGGDSFEDIVDERVHDGHGLVRDTGFGVDLLQDLVDVGRVGFLSLDLTALGFFGLLFGSLSGSLSSGLLSGSLSFFGGHFVLCLDKGTRRGFYTRAL